MCELLECFSDVRDVDVQLVNFIRYAMQHVRHVIAVERHEELRQYVKHLCLVDRAIILPEVGHAADATSLAAPAGGMGSGR